jgi:hypothetical protein
MSRVKQDLERLGMEDIWENGRNNYNNIWIRVSERCAGTERQNMDATMEERERERERETERLTNTVQQLRSNRENECIQNIRSGEARGGMVWWKAGVWRLKGLKVKKVKLCLLTGRGGP